MNKKILSAILACNLAAFAFVSCSNDNPADTINPYNISIKTEAKAETDGSYLVKAEGGTYTFTIERGEPWLFSIKETVNGKSILTKTNSGNRDKLETSWVNASVAKDEGISKKLIVTILPTDATEMRYINVVVANSMKSQTIAFKQPGISASEK